MNRYHHQIALEEIGEEGQSKLNASTILVIGAGGLGSPALQYLAGTGVGQIGIMDGDTIALNNLHRQTIYTEAQVGQYKSEVAKSFIEKRNSNIRIDTHNQYLNSQNAKSIISNYELILDCTDQYEVRYLINDVCVELNKTWVYAALHHHQGQLAVFNHQGSGTYRCLFPFDKESLPSPRCTETGILPTVAGIMGVMQANEALKIILDYPDILSDTLLLFDGKKYSFSKMKFSRLTNIVLETQKNRSSENFNNPTFEVEYENIQNTPHQLIDIRTIDERQETPIHNATPVDPTEVANFVNQFQNTVNHILVCSKGLRSRQLTKHLLSEGHSNVFSLIGGAKSVKKINLTVQ